MDNSPAGANHPGPVYRCERGTDEAQPGRNREESMKIRLTVVDVETGETLEVIGTCITDNPSRAVQMYDQDEKWIELGHQADIRWEDVTNEA